MGPSLPVGARIRTRLSRDSIGFIRASFLHLFLTAAEVFRYTGQYSAELGQWFADQYAFARNAKFTQSPLVITASLFYDGHRLTHFAAELEITEQHHGIGKVTDINRLGHRRTEHSLLSCNDYGNNILRTAVGEE